MILRDDILAVIDKRFLSVEIKGDTKVVKNCFNRKKSSLNSIILLTEDVFSEFEYGQLLLFLWESKYNSRLFN